MVKSVKALIKPELLVWARKNAGLTVEVAAKKAQIKPEKLQSWETGKESPTVKQLRKLGNIYKRPMAVFYLPEPPKDFQPIREFRRFPGNFAEIESPQLRLEIRRARDRREIALELCQDLEGELPHFLHEASLTDNPESLAEKIRNILGISYEHQIKINNEYEALNWWRTAIEDSGALTFQTTRVYMNEMRGFSISETPFPVIVVNGNDTPRGRIFTMLHEYVHIMLHDGGLCDLGESGLPPEKREVEVFCNRVAGGIMVPKSCILKENIVLRKGRGKEWTEEEISTLARKYKASREVILRRLLIFNVITKTFYQKKISEYEKEYEARKERTQEGGPEPYILTISKVGKTFIRLVLNNYYQENITSSDISDFLNTKLKHMGKIEHEVMGHSIEFGAVS